MATEPTTRTPFDDEPDDRTEDAHEHGVVLHQLEPVVPLLAEDGDEEAPRA